MADPSPSHDCNVSANVHLVPYVRPFPVWKHEERTDFITGHLTGEWEWAPHWYGQKKFATRREAEAWYREATGA